jgi:hypothetical protein
MIACFNPPTRMALVRFQKATRKVLVLYQSNDFSYYRSFLFVVISMLVAYTVLCNPRSKLGIPCMMIEMASGFLL